MTNHKDFLGNVVDIGDYIFYSTTGRYAESRLCKITRMTPKSVFADVLKSNRPNIQKHDVIVRNSFVKVDYNEDSK